MLRERPKSKSKVKDDPKRVSSVAFKKIVDDEHSHVRLFPFRNDRPPPKSPRRRYRRRRGSKKSGRSSMRRRDVSQKSKSSDVTQQPYTGV